MSQVSMLTSVQVTDAVLNSIFADASFLWERLDIDRFILDPGQFDKADVDRRCERWCQIVAYENDPEILQQRLQWEGLDLDDIRPRLGTVRLAPEQRLPAWVETLRYIIQAAAKFDIKSETCWPIDADKPIPFEDILLPAIQVARQNLVNQLGMAEFTLESLPLSVLTQAAYTDLERSLLQRLAQLSTKTLDFEFSKGRPFGQNLLKLLGVDKIETEHCRTLYLQFVSKLLQDGLLNFFQTYPVLGRLIAIAVDFWVTATTEFIQRLNHDQSEIQQLFEEKPSKIFPKESCRQVSLDKVSEIKTALSDPHHQGRTVTLLTFESELKLVYKPKNLGLEVAWNRFLGWYNQQCQPLDLLELKVVQVLYRDDYSWVEYVEHSPCEDIAAVERFYQRAGMLLCLIYVLRGTDCHNENLIACSEHLVLIDAETLLHHDLHPIDNSPDGQIFESESVQLFDDSVLRTGLLPRWNFIAGQRIAYDISGLSNIDPKQTSQKVPRWQAINTDDMHLGFAMVTLPMAKNVPLLGAIPLSSSDHHAHIAKGFEQMYRFLMQHQVQLLAADGPFAALKHQQGRFIFRATRIYSAILQKSWTPDYFRHGVDYSIELDRLSRAFVVAQEQPNIWPVLRAELQAIEQLDIPVFTASNTCDDLKVADNQKVRQCFNQSSYQKVLDQVRDLSKADLSQQMAIIRSSFYARTAHIPAGNNRPWQTQVCPILTSEDLIREARKIATELQDRAIPDHQGGANWIGLTYVDEVERYQLKVLDDSLYSGRSGIALFLAAYYCVTDEPEFKDLAYQALHSLRYQKLTLAPASQQRWARLLGIGGATGLGSIIFTLVKVSQFLNDEALLTDAKQFASLITSQLLESDQKLDVVAGAAGAILGLLSLYEVTENVRILEQARECGQHLLNHCMSYEGSPKAWSTIAARPSTGFAHGAAGIAYALLRLYAVTQDQDYLAAALEGIQYERCFFSESHANWPYLPSSNQESTFRVQWCYGASGIGLGRLGCLRLVEDSEIEREIAMALETTWKHRLQIGDHLCCGNFGRIDLFVTAAQRLAQPHWHNLAVQNASNVIGKAKQDGGYQLDFNALSHGAFNISFFRGISGIGYELLRLARPDLPSALLWE